jgi:putative FmdB family regulatory protein
MPIYEFVCESCGRLVERLQKLTDPPPDACPECGGKMAKIMSRNSFQLKGGGWYRDLYSSKGGSGSSTDAAANGAGGAGSGTSASPADKSASDKPSSDKPATGKAAADKPAAPAAPAATPAKSD